MANFPSLVEILQNPVIEILIIIGAFVVGVIQGHIIGKAILIRFPKLQNHAKMVSIGLFFLFFINAILSVPRFASPEKIDISSVFSATSTTELASLIFTIFGVNTGFLAVLAVSVTIISLIFLRLTNISGLQKIFVIFFSSLILIATAFSRFTDYTPTNFEVFLYFLYQLGITIGIASGTARKIKQT